MKTGCGRPVGYSGWFLCLWLLFSISSSADADALNEYERVEQYHRRGYTWPPPIVPQTQGWRKLYERRFRQIRYVEDLDKKYDGWLQSMASAVHMPNFTETGWGLTRAPDNLTTALRQGIHDGLETAALEMDVDVILGPRCLFIWRPDLTKRVLEELQPILEAWSGKKLVPYRAYGFRLYRNDSRLLMHVDKSQTHVISAILHIDSSEDSDPWPVVIEDYQGNTNEAVLTSGDILLYESGKCFHGRPHRFTGSWYSSIFVHYYPADEGWENIDHKLEAHYAVPPDWDETPQEPNPYPTLQMVGTSMKEEECPDLWCNLGNTIKWQGPAEEDYVLTTGGKRYYLYGDDHDNSSHDEL